MGRCGFEVLRLDRPNDMGGAGQAGVGRGQNLDAHALLQGLADGVIGVDHTNLLGWVTLTQQTAQNRAGHVAPANENQQISGQGCGAGHGAPI